MNIRLVTDTAADIPFTLVKKYNIGIVPHVVDFEGRSWKLGIDISVKDYYEKLFTLDYIPKSSTPTPQVFFDVFQESLEKFKYEHIIYISVAEKLTSTVAVARIAAKKLKNRVTIIDSKSASGVQGLIVLAVLKMIERKIPIKEIVKQVEELISEYILDVGFYTLENVYKSGRLKSKFILNLTKIIKIKPVAVMERPGVLVSQLPGFFSGKHMERRLIKIILKRAKREIAYDMIVSHVKNLEGSERIISILKKRLNISTTYITEASPIVGTNTGMHTIIVSLIPSVD